MLFTIFFVIFSISFQSLPNLGNIFPFKEKIISNFFHVNSFWNIAEISRLVSCHGVPLHGLLRHSVAISKQINTKSPNQFVSPTIVCLWRRLLTKMYPIILSVNHVSVWPLSSANGLIETEPKKNETKYSSITTLINSQTSKVGKMWSCLMSWSQCDSPGDTMQQAYRSTAATMTNAMTDMKPICLSDVCVHRKDHKQLPGFVCSLCDNRTASLEFLLVWPFGSRHQKPKCFQIPK